jgi:two-component system chemotaxis response regulator CheB
MAFEIIGIGASSGGIAALPLVIDALPAGFPAAVLVVQHVHPSFPSQLAHILSRRARLPVSEAVDGEPVRPGTIITAQPNWHLRVVQRHIQLTQADKVRFSRPSIDYMLESIAAAYGACAIGVVLTGYGSDGAIGLTAIKASGGTTIVQDPADAEQGGMPTAAWATHCIDYRLSLSDIGPMLVELVANSQSMS